MSWWYRNYAQDNGSHGEASSLHIELKPSISRQSLDDGWQALLFPQTSEDQGWSPLAGGLSLDVGPFCCLNNAQFLTELGETRQQPINLSGNQELLGSITDAGAKVRSTLTTVAATIKKRGGNVRGRIKEALDLLARNPKADPFQVLFSSSNPP